MRSTCSIAPRPPRLSKGRCRFCFAREAQVSHFVYQSAHRLDELAYLPHVASKLAIQSALTTCGLSYTLICPNHFYQNDEAVCAPLMEKDLYATPLGAIGCDGVDARDIAEAGAIALTESGHAGQGLSAGGARTAYVAGGRRGVVRSVATAHSRRRGDRGMGGGDPSLRAAMDAL